jgi:cytochrome oxidase assembly protein ShyY1
MAPTPETLERPAIRILAAVIALVALGLCRWQVQRDGERNEGRAQALLVAGLPPLGDGDVITAEAGWRLVSWRGHFTGARALLAGAQHGDQRGYRLLQVFLREGGSKILVDRGWIAADRVEELLATPEEGPEEVLTGQLRPVSGEVDTVPFEGHGTYIWQLGQTRAPAVVLGAGAAGIVLSGGLDGGPVEGAVGIGGFEAVPDRDNTSAHYASQWLVVALGGLAFAFPGAVMRLWRKLSADGGAA